MKLILDFSLLYEKLFVRIFEDQNEISENDVDICANTAVRDVLCNECSACFPPIKQNFVMVPYGHVDTCDC